MDQYLLILRGMNIHLPAILMFTRGTRFGHTAMWKFPTSTMVPQFPAVFWGPVGRISLWSHPTRQGSKKRGRLHTAAAELDTHLTWPLELLKIWWFLSNNYGMDCVDDKIIPWKNPMWSLSTGIIGQSHSIWKKYQKYYWLAIVMMGTMWGPQWC